jgi:predicted DNA-binding transcriptional regulator AlpA
MGRALHIPNYEIEFSDGPTILTAELLEELGISYDTLASRIRTQGFPKPVRSGHSGRKAVYDKQEVLTWLKKHGFRLPVAKLV